MASPSSQSWKLFNRSRCCHPVFCLWNPASSCKLPLNAGTVNERPFLMFLFNPYKIVAHQMKNSLSKETNMPLSFKINEATFNLRGGRNEMLHSWHLLYPHPRQPHPSDGLFQPGDAVSFPKYISFLFHWPGPLPFLPYFYFKIGWENPDNFKTSTFLHFHFITVVLIMKLFHPLCSSRFLPLW